ncbi:ATP-binding cassette domain-containing protein [Desulfuribacillus alkaliarsenatis]|uniref:ABC transporter domain-containing protein n=1 Tax=Desulfuribacillus alkaliarsenatis TaxID=766136 RepID=A0A1E5G496_9FIRM|nr:ATP-binding cassette domain-containing protein [Desulfuribacillus alkaliarsenatis]OEF97908.1 hypothetical protein BHF68_12615 [Desulfuribacillus alkaliarsenatis]
MQIQCKNLSYIYQQGTPFEELAIDDISFTIPSRSFVSVLGRTGSGKTTALQLIKGLIKPSTGEIIYQGENHENPADNSTNHSDNKLYVFSATKQPRNERNRLEALWNSIGYLFQYPEHQLFEETVEADIAYGPKNLKYTDDKVHKLVASAMELTGLEYSEFAKRAPFQLSGGQMRRVALAGILAMEPKMMILDEPMAGLDSVSKVRLTNMIYNLHKELRWTTLCVSHHIDELWKYTDYYLVFADKKVNFAGTSSQLLDRWQERSIEVEPPSLVKLALSLQAKGIIQKSLIELEEELKTEDSFAAYLRGIIC